MYISDRVFTDPLIYCGPSWAGGAGCFADASELRSAIQFSRVDAHTKRTQFGVPVRTFLHNAAPGGGVLRYFSADDTGLKDYAKSCAGPENLHLTLSEAELTQNVSSLDTLLSALEQGDIEMTPIMRQAYGTGGKDPIEYLKRVVHEAQKGLGFTYTTNVQPTYGSMLADVLDSAIANLPMPRCDRLVRVKRFAIPAAYTETRNQITKKLHKQGPFKKFVEAIAKGNGMTSCEVFDDVSKDPVIVPYMVSTISGVKQKAPFSDFWSPAPTTGAPWLYAYKGQVFCNTTRVCESLDNVSVYVQRDLQQAFKNSLVEDHAYTGCNLPAKYVVAVSIDSLLALRVALSLRCLGWHVVPTNGLSLYSVCRALNQHPRIVYRDDFTGTPDGVKATPSMGFIGEPVYPYVIVSHRFQNRLAGLVGKVGSSVSVPDVFKLVLSLDKISMNVYVLSGTKRMCALRSPIVHALPEARPSVWASMFAPCETLSDDFDFPLYGRNEALNSTSQPVMRNSTFYECYSYGGGAYVDPLSEMTYSVAHHDQPLDGVSIPVITKTTLFSWIPTGTVDCLTVSASKVALDKGGEQAVLLRTVASEPTEKDIKDDPNKRSSNSWTSDDLPALNTPNLLTYLVVKDDKDSARSELIRRLYKSTDAAAPSALPATVATVTGDVVEDKRKKESVKQKLNRLVQRPAFWIGLAACTALIVVILKRRAIAAALKEFARTHSIYQVNDAFEKAFWLDGDQDISYVLVPREIFNALTRIKTIFLFGVDIAHVDCVFKRKHQVVFRIEGRDYTVLRRVTNNSFILYDEEGAVVPMELNDTL